MVVVEASEGPMSRRDDLPSSDDLIREARADLARDRPSSEDQEPGAGTEMPDLVRPADRIETSPVRSPVPPSVASRPSPVPRVGTVHPPSDADGQRRTIGQRFALGLGIVLLLLTGFMALAFVGGLLEGDLDFGEDVGGFLFTMALFGVSGLALVRRSRPRRSDG